MIQPFPGLSVLLADSEPIVGLMLETMLREMGAQRVRNARSLEHAMILLAADVPDIAVLDLRLTGDLSLQLAQVLSSKGCPAVFTTTEFGIAERKSLNLQLVLTKPFSPAQLRDALTFALRGSHGHR